MSDKPIFGEDPDPKAALRNQGLALMLKGGFYGAVVFVSILVFIYIFVGISLLLPPESKQMPDPNLQGALDAPVQTVTV
jgi:hypothetical protein